MPARWGAGRNDPPGAPCPAPISTPTTPSAGRTATDFTTSWGSVGTPRPCPSACRLLGAFERATAVIFAHDLPVKGRERFAGKPVIDVGVKAAVNDAGSLVDKALAAADDPSAARVPAGGESSEESEEGSEHWARRLQRSVMTGVSYMIPFVAAGGLLIALGFLLGGYDIALTPGGADKTVAEAVAHDYSLWSLPGSVEGAAGSGLTLYLGSVFFLLGQAAMNFLVPALAGYIAFGLAGRPGIAPGFAMGAIAVSVGSGFIGGLIGGILAGYVAAWFTGLNVPAWLRGLMPVVIIPLGTTLAVGAVMYMLLGRPLASLMTALQDGLTSMSQGGSAVFLGIILGLMMCFDLGGPVNKAAYLFGTAGLSAASASNTAPYEIMATVMAAGMVPPLAMSAATFLRSRLFTKTEVENGRSAWLLGLSFISEGAIPFAAADPLRVIPATMAGGAVTGAMTMAMHVGSRAPHGGVFVAFAITNFGGFLLAILAGTVVSTALVIVLKGLGRNADGKKSAEAQAAAAKRLHQLVKDYAIDPRMQLDAETGLLLNLVGDLETKAATDVTTLGFTPLVTALKAANEKVRSITGTRADDRALKIMAQLKTARQASDKACHALLAKVDALALVEGKADYAAFIAFANEKVKHYKQEAIPSKKKGSDPEKPADPKEPKQPKDPKTPEQPKDPKKPGGADGDPDIHLPEE